MREFEKNSLIFFYFSKNYCIFALLKFFNSMQKEDVLKAINSPIEANGGLSLYDIRKLNSSCESFSLSFDDDNYEYYYEVNIDDMTKEGFPIDCIRGKGWRVSEDGTKALRHI